MKTRASLIGVAILHFLVSNCIALQMLVADLDSFADQSGGIFMVSDANGDQTVVASGHDFRSPTSSIFLRAQFPCSPKGSSLIVQVISRWIA